jgi:hypothetical protein
MSARTAGSVRSHQRSQDGRSSNLQPGPPAGVAIDAEVLNGLIERPAGGVCSKGNGRLAGGRGAPLVRVEVVIAPIAQAASDGGGDGLEVVLPLVGSFLVFLGGLVTLWVNGYRTSRNRRRNRYSGGWAAVQAYKEMAFAVRRRNVDDRSEERVRISEAMREIQKELAYYEAMIGESGSATSSTRS